MGGALRCAALHTSRATFKFGEGEGEGERRRRRKEEADGTPLCDLSLPP